MGRSIIAAGAAASVAAAAPPSATVVLTADDVDDNVGSHSAMDSRYRLRFSWGGASRRTGMPVGRRQSLQSQ